MKPFLIRWLVTTIAVLVAVTIIPGIETPGGMLALLGASLFLGIVNALVRPFLLILSIPLILVSMGLFLMVINAFMLKMVSWIVPGFEVEGFWSAIFGGLLISFVSWSFSAFFRDSEGQVQVLTHHTQAKEPKEVKGRVIDV